MQTMYYAPHSLRTKCEENKSSVVSPTDANGRGRGDGEGEQSEASQVISMTVFDRQVPLLPAVNVHRIRARDGKVVTAVTGSCRARSRDPISVCSLLDLEYFENLEGDQSHARTAGVVVARGPHV